MGQNVLFETVALLSVAIFIVFFFFLSEETTMSEDGSENSARDLRRLCLYSQAISDE